MKKVKIQYLTQKEFIEVRLYDTVQEVQKVTKDKTCSAMYRPNGVVIWPKRKVYPKLGTIYLSKERIGAGLIAHEVFHCSMDYASKKLNLKSLKTNNDKHQEEIAYFHGYMVKEICNWLNDSKLW